MAQQLSTNTFGFVKWIVSSDATQGTHTTIQAAVNAAATGDVIGIRPGTYTENLTLKGNLTLTSFPIGGQQPIQSVKIIGKISDGSGGYSCSINGIYLQTNSDYIASLANSSTFNFNGCYFNASNNTPFNITNGSGNIFVRDCGGDIGTTGIALYSMTHGDLWIFNSQFTNTGSSITLPTLSDGALYVYGSTIDSQIASTGTGILEIYHSRINTGSIGYTPSNFIAVTCGGSLSNYIEHCEIQGGSASAISVSTGSTLNLYNTIVSSSNTNAISGVGTLNYGSVVFSGSSSTINTSTQNPVPLPVKQGGTGLATLTAHTLQVGNGTSSPTQLAVGTTGQVLAGATGADPAFTATPSVTSITLGGGSALGNYVTAGTFTPALSFGGASTGITYAARSGSYTRIGNIICFTIDIELSNKGSSTGSVLITGLPFTANATFIFAISADHLTFSGMVDARSPATNTISIDQWASGGARAVLDDTAFINSTYVQISGSFLV